MEVYEVEFVRDRFPTAEFATYEDAVAYIRDCARNLGDDIIPADVWAGHNAVPAKPDRWGLASVGVVLGGEIFATVVDVSEYRALHEPPFPAW